MEEPLHVCEGCNQGCKTDKATNLDKSYMLVYKDELRLFLRNTDIYNIKVAALSSGDKQTSANIPCVPADCSCTLIRLIVSQLSTDLLLWIRFTVVHV